MHMRFDMFYLIEYPESFSQSEFWDKLRFFQARAGMATTPTFTALIRDDGPWWIGWVEEVPGVNAQEHSREELLDSLRQVLREALEFNRLEALEAAGPGSEKLALSL
jgi:predicted RNase H-like HicB family nuclease